MMPDTDWSAFTRTIDDHVSRLLGSAAIHQPPVDAIDLARRLDIDVLVDATQQPRGRQVRVAGRASIFIRPEPRHERRQWAVAHELGEVVACDLFSETGIDIGEISPTLREQAANLVATALLLPRSWFLEDARRLSGDVLKLKQRYATASHELVAFRLLDLPIPSVVTVFDQGRATRRRGNWPSRVPQLDRLEESCWREIRKTGLPYTIDTEERRIAGWPIHEPGWQREILRTTYAACE
jgi:IrrE N-terminal-like domain